MRLMGNASVRRTSVAGTNCASGTYTSLQHQTTRNVTGDEQINSVQTTTSSVCSSFTSLFKRGSTRSSGPSSQSSEYKVEAWPLSQLETLFLPLFPTRVQHKTKECTFIADLADGAFSKVCKVHYDNSTYAIKIISKSKVINENLVNCILQESEILKAVGHHPFIVKLHDNWQSKRKLYILTEFVPRGELYDLLQKYIIFPLLIVQLYIAQLALVLDFLHNAGVIYRDLKPENILLDEQFDLKVIDFGFSKWLPYGSHTQTICGTPKYMAPEIWTGEPYGHSVDWWSLGIVACRMLTNQYVRMEPDPSPISKPKTLYLPDSVQLDMPTKDLLLRLLELDEFKRLKSLRALQQIRFYHKFNIDEVKNKQIVGKQLWQRFYPNFH